MQGFTASFQGKGPQEEDNAPPPLYRWEKEVAEVQPVALQLLGERSMQPRPRCAFPQALAWCAWRDLTSDAK